MANTPNYNYYKPNRLDNLPVDNTLANNFTMIDNDIKNRANEITALDDRVDNIIASSGTSSTEVVDARGSFDLLRTRLDNSDLHYQVVKVVGDEVSDDTTAIQTAINTNALNGVWTVIPKGNYKLTSPLYLPDNAKIIMHKNTRLARYHNDNIFQNGTTGDTQGKSNISIIGGKLDLRGHILNGASQDGTGLALGYASNIYLADLEVYNVYYSHGIELCAIDGAIVERCGFYGFILDSGGTRTTAEAIQIERGTSSGFPYFGANDNTICKNIKIRDCKFGASTDSTAWNVAIGCHGNSSPVNIMADGVEISGCVSTTPLLTKIAQFQGFKNVTFERNTFTAPHGIEIYDDAINQTKVRLLNNKITTTGFEGLYLSGVDGLTSDGNTINGYTNSVALVNSCKNIKLGASDDYSAQTSDAFNAQATSSYIIINGVTIRKSGRHAFNIFGGCSHFKVMNCMILDVADTGNAFNFAGASTKIGHVKGNHIVDTVMVNVVAATSGMDRLFFNDNFYAASISTPINSTATNSDTTGNHTF
jgi:hypothetical protein